MVAQCNIFNQVGHTWPSIGPFLLLSKKVLLHTCKQTQTLERTSRCLDSTNCFTHCLRAAFFFSWALCLPSGWSVVFFSFETKRPCKTSNKIWSMQNIWTLWTWYRTDLQLLWWLSKVFLELPYNSRYWMTFCLVSYFSHVLYPNFCYFREAIARKKLNFMKQLEV